MSTVRKHIFKLKPSGLCQKVKKERAEVTFKNPSCLALSLPRVTWQQLLIGLAGENQWLRQQSEQANSETGATILAPGTNHRQSTQQCKKQPNCPRSMKPQIIFQVCPGCEKASERKSTFYVHQSRFQDIGDNSTSAPLGENCPNQSAGHAVKQTSIGQQKVSRRSSPELHPSGKIERLTQTIASASQTETLFSARMLLFSNVACQTEPILESRGVNTKLKSRQLKSTPPIPNSQRERKSRRGNNSKVKLSTPTNERISTSSLSLPAAEEISPVVKSDQKSDCEKESRSNKVYKISQDLQQLLSFTKIKMNDMKRKHIETNTFEDAMCCFCCQEKDHDLAQCSTLRMINDGCTQFSKPCLICKENHPPVHCGWIEVLTLVDKFSEDQQKELLESCPFLDSICDKKERSILNSCSWPTLSEKMQSVKEQIFEFPYERQVEKSTTCSIANEHKEKEVSIKFPQNIDELADYTFSKIEQLVYEKEISIPETHKNYCVYCKRQHKVAECELRKLKSESDTTKKCSICTSINHQLLGCPWVQILDLLNSLSTHHQMKLLEWCPYLEKFADYVEKPEENCQNEEAEIRKNTEAAKQAKAEYRKVNKTHAVQGERLCFYCHQNHLVRNCVLFKEKKNRRKENLLARPFKTQQSQYSVVGAERLTKEQFFLTRSSTAGNVSTEDRWRRYLKYSTRNDKRFSFPMNNEEARKNNSAD